MVVHTLNTIIFAVVYGHVHNNCCDYYTTERVRYDPQERFWHPAEFETLDNSQMLLQLSHYVGNGLQAKFQLILALFSSKAGLDWDSIPKVVVSGSWISSWICFHSLGNLIKVCWQLSRSYIHAEYTIVLLS